MRQLWAKFRAHRRAIKAVRRQYGRLLPYPLAAQWAKEDAAFARLAGDVLDAAARGVDTSFLTSCPDLTALAVRRDEGAS